MQVTNLRARGVQFLDVPDKYYTNLRERLKQSPVSVKEDVDMVRNISSTQGDVTSQSLRSRHDRHFVGITRYNALI